MQAKGVRGDHAPIFILGPPRCGSTVLYQALTNYFDVLYIDNLAARWARSLYLGMALSRRTYELAPHDNFTAEYGDTFHAGLWHAPSECGAFWYRWIPEDQHHVGPSDITSKMVEELRLEINAIQNRWGRPMMFKNLHVGQRLAWTKAAFPQARYVCIHRSIDRVVDSIMEARARLGIPRDKLWSTRPATWTGEQGFESERAMVERQVQLITESINQDLDAMDRRLVRHVSYTSFSHELIDDLGQWLGLQRRPGGKLPSFSSSAEAREG